MWHTVKWWTVTQWYDDNDMLDYVWMTWLTVLKLLSMSRLLVAWAWAVHKKTFWMTWLDSSWHKQTIDEKTFFGHEQTLDKSADLCLSHSTVLKRSCEGHLQPQLQSKLEVIKVNSMVIILCCYSGEDRMMPYKLWYHSMIWWCTE